MITRKHRTITKERDSLQEECVSTAVSSMFSNSPDRQPNDLNHFGQPVSILCGARSHFLSLFSRGVM